MSPSGTLNFHQVGKRYRSHGATLDVLEDISLDVRPGEFVSIVGASGCGKSTLLRLVLGLDDDYRGDILHDGERVRGTSLARGIVFQEHRLFPWLTVEQNVALGLENNRSLSAREKRRLVAEHIELVGLTPFAAAWPSQLSGGMSQRVAIARGLVNRPRVLLLDEPFGALDALTRTHLQHELQRIWAQEGITMILVTHDVEEAVFLGDRVVVMQPRPGRIKRVIDVPLPRPRERNSFAFTKIREDVLRDFEVLRDDQLVTAPPPLPASYNFAW
ncbi:ABC transporter ATP-binding protein [Aromatoleum toluclasticum]|uniref:ABC transporter ATP-binding protein n=1 Tax=Aromatoleum toluclasticum TaxID=92003 RepID=UPI001D183D19|nr:ABC transporter ATP-binding protein [Aromatoleum toluclasticum]MCC4116861.1 ABC transporter ATP-binding protein [Aromatoleum toluclasticum]